MKLRATPLIAALFLACCCTRADAAKYPPGPDGPGGACEDTLEIYDVQNSSTCRPGTACAGFGTGGSVGCDSVFGVRGIVTGIKNNGTSRTFYMQSRRANLQYTGMDVFNGNGLSNPNLQIGDSVSVSGKVEEGFKKTLPSVVLESGETEISGFDANNATVTYADLPVNIHSTGNSLPAAHTLSIADIRFPACNGNSSTPNASAATGEPWESALVKVIGPLVVGRRVYDGATADPPVNCTTCPSYDGIETRLQSGLHGGGMLCYFQNQPGDSIYIDMTSFVTMTPPPVGTVIDSVYGILQTGGSRAGFNQIMSWRIAVRSSAPGYGNSSTADLYLATAPEVSDAYPVADDSVRVEFDRAVTEASVTNPVHYSLVVSERSVDYAHAIGDNAVVCHIVGAFTVGDLDSITVFGQTGQVNGLTQNVIKGRAFVNGLLSIPMIQAPDQASLDANPCVDRSKYSGPGITSGPRLSFTGVVTGRFFTREYYLQDEAGGPRSGMLVFQPSQVLTIGHKYLMAAGVTEFAGETEANGPKVVQDLGAVSPPSFFSSTLQILDDFACDNPPGTSLNGEDYEGCLVEINHSVIVGADAASFLPGGFFHVTDATPPRTDSTDIEIDFGGDVTRSYVPTEGDFLTVKGILSYRFGQGVLFPRNDGDLVKTGNVDVGGGTVDRIRFAAGPNPARVTEFRFALPRRGNVELAVFDVTGRRVATVARGVFEAGAYSRKWDGRDDRGRLAGQGIYHYRLRVGSETFVLRGVRLN